VKSLSRSRATSEECEAPSFEQALQLAYQKFGSEVVLRCWKVRRGGVFGFFARETFVAGPTQPAGAAAQRPGSRKPSSTTDDRSSILSDLVEATTDEVTLGSDMLPESMFKEVLAEAEAALINAVATDRTVTQESIDPITIDGVVRIEGLRAELSKLGVGSDFLPDESETLDALVRSLAKLPMAPTFSKVGGSVLVVVGSRREALLAAQDVVANLGLSATDLIVGEPTSSARQKVTRRRAGKKMTVLVVEAPLSRRGLASILTWLDQIKPDYVLGAVPATAKPSDIEKWHAQIGRVDALALSRLESAPLVAALMGVLPVALLDGAPATTLRWVSVLLNSMLERRP
jgi:hypothetical protein